MIEPCPGNNTCCNRPEFDRGMFPCSPEKQMEARIIAKVSKQVRMQVWVVDYRYFLGGRWHSTELQGIYLTEEAARRDHYRTGARECITGGGFPELPSYMIHGQTQGCEIHFYKYEVRE